MSLETLHIIEVAANILAAALSLWMLVLSFRVEDDSPAIIGVKIFATVVLLFCLAHAGKVFGTAADPMTAFGGFIRVMFCGLGLTFVWRKNISELIAQPFAALYHDRQELEAKPYYSQATARRMQGKCAEAITMIRAELEKFPNDFEGQMLLARIQAEDLNDLPAAVLTLEYLLAQTGHEPNRIASALTTLADWQVQFAHDVDAARAALERIVTLFPDSEVAVIAKQRLAHLESRQALAARLDNAPVEIPQYQRDLGLRGLTPKVKVKEESPEEMTARFIRRLEKHPLDWEARERLAVLYATHYQRLDLAVDQLEQLLAAPNQPQKQMVNWLTMLADLHMEHAQDVTKARATLQRIVDLFPQTAFAFRARTAMEQLTLDMKPKLGGLKKEPSREWNPNSVENYLDVLNANKRD